MAGVGFTWDSAAVVAPVQKSPAEALQHYIDHLPFFIWHAIYLEGNTFTRLSVNNLLDGVDVRTFYDPKISRDEEQILNLAESSHHLIELVKQGQFNTTKEIFTALQGMVAKNEALEWGHFRGEGEEANYTARVYLGDNKHYSAPVTERGAEELNRLFAEGVETLQTFPPFERALAFFLFGALTQFFFDGNKRTSRHIMNGILMSHGYNAISIPPSSAEEFNSLMVEFYQSKNGAPMMAFLAGCYWI